jgi:hypothetical protein
MSRIQNPGGGLQNRVLHLMVESRKQNSLGHSELGLGIYLEFGNWSLYQGGLLEMKVCILLERISHP